IAGHAASIWATGTMQVWFAILENTLPQFTPVLRPPLFVRPTGGEISTFAAEPKPSPSHLPIDVAPAWRSDYYYPGV
ncbi:MAG: hypothetical protein WA463_06270, partial [Terriglobales bacterium]